MASLNKVFLMGNLTRDPETRFTTGGAALCKFGLAINRRFMTNSGDEREETCFVDIEVWGKQAESCGNYLRKGVPALVEGRLRFDQWEDRDSGSKRSRLMVTAERVQFIGRPAGRTDFDQEEHIDSGDAPEAASAPPRRQQQQNDDYRPAPKNEAPRSHQEMPPFKPVENAADDIPF